MNTNLLEYGILTWATVYGVCSIGCGALHVDKRDTDTTFGTWEVVCGMVLLFFVILCVVT